MNAATSGTPESKQVLHAIEMLVRFALHKGLIQAADADYSRNLLLEDFGFSEPYGDEVNGPVPDGPQAMLDVMIDYGAAHGMIPENTDTYRDLLDAKIMGRLMARPSDVTAQFRTVQQEQGIIAATRQFYNLCIDSNYIRMDRVAKMNTGGTPARMAILRLPSISQAGEKSEGNRHG